MPGDTVHTCTELTSDTVHSAQCTAQHFPSGDLGGRKVGLALTVQDGPGQHLVWLGPTFSLVGPTFSLVGPTFSLVGTNI